MLHLAGRLTEAQVPDLLEACATAPSPPLVELHELVSADTVGVDALLRLEVLGAELVGMPEYLRLTLDVMARERKR